MNDIEKLSYHTIIRFHIDIKNKFLVLETNYEAFKWSKKTLERAVSCLSGHDITTAAGYNCHIIQNALLKMS